MGQAIRLPHLFLSVDTSGLRTTVATTSAAAGTGVSQRLGMGWAGKYLSITFTVKWGTSLGLPLMCCIYVYLLFGAPIA
jgi:hypothetical protein